MSAYHTCIYSHEYACLLANIDTDEYACIFVDTDTDKYAFIFAYTYEYACNVCIYR
jgi:hypothetical protein